MIIVLFVVLIGMTLLSGLGIAMLENHFKKIEKSLKIYADPKAYKPMSNILLIDNIIADIKKLHAQETDGLATEKIINKHFYEQEIGIFPYRLVEKVVSVNKFLVWGILGIQVAIVLMSGTPGQSTIQFILIVASSILCMLTMLFGVIHNIKDKRNKLIQKIHDYCMHIYPKEIQRKEHLKELQQFMDKIDKIEIVDVVKTEDEADTNEALLKEKDIKTLLGKLDKQA